MDQFLVRFKNKKQKLCEDEPDELDDAYTSGNLEAGNSPSPCTLSVQNKCHIFNGNFFKLVEDDGKKVCAQCQYCPKIIHGQKGSTGNFLSHIKVG